MNDEFHKPVLLNEMLKIFDPKQNQNYIDATFGFGGHSAPILEKIKPKGKLLGIERDEEVLRQAQDKFLKFQNLILVGGNFKNLKEIVKLYNFPLADGILFDLGFNSWQIGESGRGFSFKKDEPLDMRFDQSQDLTAEKILNFWPQDKLSEIFCQYGEESDAKRIAHKITEARRSKPIKTTFDLIEIIKQVKKYRGKIHPATKIFQALRIAVNDELNNIKIALQQTPSLLKRNGELIIISFHSLEDRIIKNFLRSTSSGQVKTFKIINKKVIKPNYSEILFNPRSRSAKLRAATKI